MKHAQLKLIIHEREKLSMTYYSLSTHYDDNNNRKNCKTNKNVQCINDLLLLIKKKKINQ